MKSRILKSLHLSHLSLNCILILSQTKDSSFISSTILETIKGMFSKSKPFRAFQIFHTAAAKTISKTCFQIDEPFKLCILERRGMRLKF
ncbi:hypothetical protein Hdeb2414_s0100g00793341 [Helianthus debilis subsp. tardiflorus]